LYIFEINNKLLLAFTALLCILSCSHICRGQEFVYLDKEGDEERILRITKKQVPGKQTLILNSSHKYSEHTYMPPGQTRRWQLKDTSVSHDFLVERVQNEIKISGRYAGESINKKHQIDDKPWINKLDHGLSAWVNSEEEEIVFWTLKLNSGLDPVEFEAEKVDTEEVITPAGTFQTIKVKLRLHGFLISNFWSATLWYRIEDGLFIRYEGDSGPGTSLRTIVLQKIL
jgi:hypothetical protein